MAELWGSLHRHHRREDTALRGRVRDIANTRVRYGHWRIYTLLRREGWKISSTRVIRINGMIFPHEIEINLDSKNILVKFNVLG